MARDLSPELARAVRESGTIIPEIDITTPDGNLILSSNTSDPLQKIRIVGGSIDTDDSSEIPGSGTIDILVDDATRDQVMPYGPLSPLSPVRNALVYVRYTSPGAATTTPYGAYDIASTTAVEADTGIKLTLEIYDNARRVERAKFYRPRVINRGYPYDDVWISLLRSILPFSRIDIVPTGETVVLLSWDVEDSRLRAVNDLALMVGYRIEWNHNGIGDVLVGPNTPPNAEPAWTFVDGGNAKITTANRTLSDEAAFNGVIISGEAAGSDKPPVRAEAWDLDPTSPTYFDPAKPEESSYGANPYFHTSPFAHTPKQAKAIAMSLLPGKMGVVERLQIDCVMNPGVQVADPIRVERPKLGVSGTYIVESTSIPLLASGGRMTIVCRERRLIG